MKQRIRQMPHPALRQVAEPFPTGGWSDSQLAAVQDLRDTFAATENCIGLAANQIGAMWRVIIVDITPDRRETYCMMNPVIVKQSEDCQSVHDGCMSVFEGKRFATTKRPKRITVEWIDPRHNQPRKQKFTGLLAAAIHHEVDHLDGIIFVDRIIDKTEGFTPIKSDKGEENGTCNRTVCGNVPATCFNSSTKRWYCIPCARRINEVNGTEVCTIKFMEGQP